MISNPSEEKTKLIKLAERVFKKRYLILIGSISESTLLEFKIQMIIEGFRKIKKHIEKLSYEIVLFQVSLIINGTKFYEAFSLNQDGQKRFNYNKESLENTIQKNSSSIKKALFHKVIIKPFTKQHVIDQAVQNIRQNYLLTKLIAGKEFTRQKLDEFLSVQQYKLFDQNEQNIQGLSSFDGKTVFIHQNYDYDYKYKYTEPDQKIDRYSIKLNKTNLLALIWLIEYQLMENLSRWSSNSHILSISPERNENLRVGNNQMVGSGNFYLTKAHKYENTYYNPFELNYKLIRGKYFYVDDY